MKKIHIIVKFERLLAEIYLRKIFSHIIAINTKIFAKFLRERKEKANDFKFCVV